MKTILIIFLLLPTGEARVVNMARVDTVDECMSQAVVVNQESDNPFNAACIPVLERGLL